jgi:hypothetical protein
MADVVAGYLRSNPREQKQEAAGQKPEEQKPEEQKAQETMRLRKKSSEEELHHRQDSDVEQARIFVVQHRTQPPGHC